MTQPENKEANKDWTGNSVALLKTAGFANNSLTDRQSQDYYATSPAAGKMLLELDDFSNIWECAAGEGHLAEVFREAGLLGKASDKYDRGYCEAIDFLTTGLSWDGDIVTNPPYKYGKEFIEKAMSILKDGRKLALFFPIRYLSSKSRRDIFEKYPPYKVWVSSSRLICAANGEFDKVKGSAVDYAWFIWHKGYDGETKLGWFN